MPPRPREGGEPEPQFGAGSFLLYCSPPLLTFCPFSLLPSPSCSTAHLLSLLSAPALLPSRPLTPCRGVANAKPGHSKRSEESHFAICCSLLAPLVSLGVRYSIFNRLFPFAPAPDPLFFPFFLLPFPFFSVIFCRQILTTGPRQLATSLQSTFDRPRPAKY